MIYQLPFRGVLLKAKRIHCFRASSESEPARMFIPLSSKLKGFHYHHRECCLINVSGTLLHGVRVLGGGGGGDQ
jgi:hypothetical protein